MLNNRNRVSMKTSLSIALMSHLSDAEHLAGFTTVESRRMMVRHIRMAKLIFLRYDGKLDKMVSNEELDKLFEETKI